MIKFDVAYNQYITSLRSITNYVSHEQMHTWLESHVHKLSGKQKQAAAESTDSVIKESRFACMQTSTPYEMFKVPSAIIKKYLLNYLEICKHPDY